MKPKLIATDVDGTLINSSSELTDRTLAALKEAQLQGIKVILATGRMCCCASIFAKQIGITDPCVFYNGAMIMNPATEEIYFRQGINAELTARVLAYYREKGWYLQKYVNDRLYVVDSSDERTQFYVAITKADAISLGEKFWTEHTAVTKLLACSKKGETCTPMLEETKRIFGSELYVVSSWERVVEMGNPDVNKAHSVARAAAMLGIKREDVACFGDSSNDNEMLRWAGLGVAMGNAKEETKQAADAITDTNDNDGLAQFVENLLSQNRR